MSDESGKVIVDWSDLMDAHISLVEALNLCDDRCVNADVVKLIDEAFGSVNKLVNDTAQQIRIQGGLDAS